MLNCVRIGISFVCLLVTLDPALGLYFSKKFLKISNLVPPKKGNVAIAFWRCSKLSSLKSSRITSLASEKPVPNFCSREAVSLNKLYVSSPWNIYITSDQNPNHYFCLICTLFYFCFGRTVGESY